MKKFTTMAICFVLIACMVAGGSLAYLTDRDSVANVFTVGDVRIELTEDFEQGATLTPGVDIKKVPTIKNTGVNDAWVWMEFAIPSALDKVSPSGTEEGSNENVIHWNPLGATWEGYVKNDYVTKAFADGWLTADMFPEEATNVTDYIISNNMTWDHNNKLVNGANMYTTEINDVDYNVYVIPYNKALTPGETTLPSVVKVYLDAHVDIDTNGDWYKVDKGVATKLAWNTESNGSPVIYVSAYGIQNEGFATVDEAYAAYKGQWDDPTTDKNEGSEWAPTPILVENVADMAAALDAGEKNVIVKGVEFSENPFNGHYYTDRNITFVDCEFTADMNWMYINNATFENCNFNSTGAAIHFDELKGELVVNDCTFVAGKVQIGADGTAVFNNCEFGATSAESIWSEKGMRFYAETTFNNCEFNNRVVLAGANDLAITFNACTMNGGTPVYYTDNSDGIIRGSNIPNVTINN